MSRIRTRNEIQQPCDHDHHGPHSFIIWEALSYNIENTIYFNGNQHGSFFIMYENEILYDF